MVGRGWAFPPHIDARGRVALTGERSEIEQAIRIILLTPLGQRVMRPTFGCGIHDLIFAPMNTQTLAQARRHVAEALAMWEPRINVDDINVRVNPAHDGALLIDIKYEIKSTLDQRSLVFPFYLIPSEIGDTHAVIDNTQTG